LLIPLASSHKRGRKLFVKKYIYYTLATLLFYKNKFYQNIRLRFDLLLRIIIIIIIIIYSSIW